LIFEVDKEKVFSSDVGQNFDKKKHTIILLHGSGQSHVVWSLTDQYLADLGYNVLALDLPGHGNSEGMSLKSIEEITDWLDKVVKVLGINDLTLVGHSQGCLVALEYSNKF
jgi:pimeloyl-ACP methyl ester carboxylesterase